MQQFFAWLNRVFQTAEWRLSLWNAIFGPGGMITGASLLAWWAAVNTKALEPFAPFSYLFAVVITALLVGLCWLAYTGARSWAQVQRFRQRSFDESKINPLDTTFQRARIRVVDLCPPVGGRIFNKTFIDCDIIGPTNVFILPDCLLVESSGEGVDAVVMSNSARPTNGFAFERCTFRQCRFYLITFVVPEQMYGPFAGVWKRLNWISLLPSSNEPTHRAELTGTQLHPDTSQKNQP